MTSPHHTTEPQPDVTTACLLDQLSDLVEVTAKVDESLRNRYQAREELLAVAHRVAAAAEPVLQSEAALITALREAAASRPSIPESCPDCQKTDGGLCGHHAGSLTVAETYNDLGHALCGPCYVDP